MMTKIRVRFIFLVAIAIVTIGCDRATKHVAVALLSTTPTRSFLYDTIRLDYTENTGAFAGGAANLINRLPDGTVVDFINVGVGPVRTGIFNVADIAITLGVGLLMIERYLSGNQRPDATLT